MPRFLPAIALVSAAACAACGDVTLKDPGLPDAQVGVPDAQPGIPDAQPGTPDARPVAPDARVPDASTPPDARPACTGGDARIEDPDTGVCYMLFTTTSTWNNALTACASLGPDTHLAALTSLEEHLLVVELTVGFDAWVGATDSFLEGQFVWVTGDLVEFEAWAANEPNNGGTSGNEEDCAIVINTGTTRPGTWDDRRCGLALPYVCERE